MERNEVLEGTHTKLQRFGTERVYFLAAKTVIESMLTEDGPREFVYTYRVAPVGMLATIRACYEHRKLMLLRTDLGS